MRKLAGILALSLVLELLSPMQAYAQPAVETSEEMISERETESIESETEHAVEESADTFVEETGQEETSEVESSQEEAVTSEMSGEYPETTVEETSETELEETMMEFVDETDTEEGEIGTEETEGLILVEEMVALENVNTLATQATDVSNQSIMYLQETYYFFEDKGYPLSAAFVLPKEMLDKNLTFTEITLSVDGAEPKELQAKDTYTFYYDWEDYGYCSFYAGYDSTIQEGKHELTYAVTICTTDNAYYSMNMTKETEFVEDNSTERVYYEIEGVEFWDCIPTQKGIEIAKICTSYIDYKSETEKVTNVQLRNHETGALVQTTLTDLELEDSDGKKHDSRYKGIYDEASDLYIWTILPDEYYYRWGRATLVLEQDIEEGLYDVILSTDAGYTYIYDSYYKATNSSVLYWVASTSSEYPDFKLFADNAGKYISLFVYGFNLTDANVPVFYDDTFSTELTEYDESDPYCHWEKHRYGMDITVKKKDISDPVWDVSGTDYNVKGIKLKVSNVEKPALWLGEGDLEFTYNPTMVYRREYIKQGNFSIKPGFRLYLSSQHVKEGDIILAEGIKYSYPTDIIDVSEEYEVCFNGLEYYIQIPSNSKLYTEKNYFYVTNKRTGKKQEIWHTSSEKDVAEPQQSNILVPANCKWEIHAAKDVGNILYSGTTTEDTEVLTAEQIIDLSKYGKLRVCIYDMDGNVVDRYQTFLSCSEYYTVEYVLNDNAEEPADMKETSTYYFKDKGLTLEIPVRENYTFMGWYSDKNLTKKVSKIAVGSKGNKTFYAKWAPDIYSIIYNANGGNGKIRTTTWKYKETGEIANNTFTRAGYVFSGWNTKKDGSGTEYTEKQILSKISENGKKQLTLYAIWEPVTYTLVLNKNESNASDGTINGSPTYIEMVYGDTITLTGKEYTWKGHTIKSWNLKPNGKGKKYNNGEIGSLTKDKDDIVMLYAQWTLEKYSIVYDYNGGKVSSKNPASYTYETRDIVLKEPKRTGYIFDGYYETDPESEEFTEVEEAISVIKKGTTGNKKLYAKWIPIAYTVILNKNSEYASYGTVRNEQDAIKECVYDDATPYTLTRDAFVWDGKEIAAWTTKPNGKGKKYVNGQELKNLTKNNSDNIVLYAQWRTENFTIQYEGVDGIKHKNPTSYTYHEQQQIKLKTISRKGYTFNGWYLNSTENEENRIEYIDRSLKKDLVICAKWTPVSYTVCLKPNAPDASAKEGLKQIVTLKYDEVLSLATDSYTREHYRIAYWSKNSKGKGTRYQSGEVCNLSVKEGSLVTLYPKWELIPYEIHYANIDFENVKNNSPKTYTYNIRKDTKLKNPTRTGYLFGGWYLEDTTTEHFNPETAEKITKIPRGSEGEKTIYAYWKPLTYYVQLFSNAKDAQDGSVIIGSTAEKQQITAGKALVFAKDSYIREGYILTGFSEKKNGKGKVYGLGSSQYVYANKANSVVKLYAIWEKASPKKVKDVSLTVSGSDLIVSYTPNEGLGYYEVEYSDSISMRNAGRIEQKDKEQNSVSISSLLSGKRYYVRVREVQIDSCENKIYGSWSSTVTIVK